MIDCNIRDILKETLKYKRLLIIANLVALLSTILIAIIPLLIPLLVDELLLDKSHGVVKFIETYIFSGDIKSYIFFILFIIILLRVSSVLLGIIQSKIFMTISKSITYKLRTSLLNHLKIVSLKEYETIHSGAITSKMVTDIETIDTFVSSTISKLILASFVLFFSSIILLWIHWQLAIFILITNPFVVFFTAKLARNIGKLKRDENKAVEVFQSSLNETLELFHQIRASNKESYFFNSVQTKAKELKEYSINFGYKSDMAMKFSYLIFLSGYEVFRAVSILAVAYSDLSVGLMLAIFSYLWVMVTPTQDIINFQYALSNAKNACKRVSEIFDMSVEPQIDNPQNPFNTESEIAIRIENLNFGYSKDKTILQNINMEIKEKSNIAIVGASGSGKTTLSNILVGFYPISSGEIYYNGVSNRDIKLSTIRENIHLILQNPKLFNDTLLFNLTLGDSYGKEEIEKALQISQLKNVIENLSDGLDTMIGKDGIKLSGGQRQRVAIARMILANPKIIIFDESTSALDIHTEIRLFKDLERFLEDKTVITIAHRLSTIKNANYIYVLEDSKIVDFGTPKELIDKDNSYFSKMI